LQGPWECVGQQSLLVSVCALPQDGQQPHEAICLALKMYTVNF
jgi:hypothetical protein